MSLVYSLATAQQAKTFPFITANFITSSPDHVAWIDEDTVIFSVGGGGTTGTECISEIRRDCNNQRSIQTWRIKDNRVSIYIENATLRCLSRGRMTFVKNDRFFTASIGQEPKDLGIEPGTSVVWNDCNPSPAKTWVDNKGTRWREGKEFRQHYDFKGANFEATRRETRVTKLIWRFPDGKEEYEWLPDGPWSRSDRLWELYYPTRVGVIVADQPYNYFVTPREYTNFFPGAISSVVGISPSGCQASFFGAKSDPVTQKTVVALYAVRVC